MWYTETNCEGRAIKRKREGQFAMDGKVENEGMPVVRLDRQLKYQGNILKIYEDTVLANGHEAHWDYIHHDGAADGYKRQDEGVSQLRKEM